MTARTLRTRRALITDMGKAGVAVLVFGLAACSSEEGNRTTSTSGSPGTTPAATPATTAAVASTTSTSDTAGFEWYRAKLGFVSAYVLARAGEAALVDTGGRGSEGDIGAALTAAGLNWGAVGHVVITHKHDDHQGSLGAVLDLAPEATWYAGAADIPQIWASRDPVAVGDGDSVNGLDIIETPGHTPGHISVLDSLGGILVAGDAMNGADGGVAGANERFTEDIDLANASISKLAGFDYEVILFGHGEPVLTGGSAAVAALAG